MARPKPDPSMLFTLAAAVAVLAYWVGLDGPFIFDDYPNLRQIPLWLDGKLGLSSLLFERGGGTFGRPVSMASFALNAKLMGYSPFAFKLVNLGLHLLIGGVVFFLIRLLLQLDTALRERATWLAGVTAALWLLHPLHASTVLYSVQRMAQMSALIVLLGLWFYLHFRQKIAGFDTWHAAAGLFVGIPVITAIAFLAKENGALLPLLCCIVELSFFLHADRPRSIKAFLWVFGSLPVAIAVVALFALPERFVAAYAGRDFNAFERLLSQGRAICDYVSQLLFPNTSRMGVFTDDFAISTGWLNPPTTVLAFAALLVASALAWRMHRHSSSVTFGWAFFLGAHALEASYLPLELYYEHRNYLPSIGLLTAVVALFSMTASLLAKHGVRADRIVKIAVAGSLLVFALGTHGRAKVWQNPLTIATSGLLAHPQSINATSYVVAHTIMLRDAEAADRLIASMMDSKRPRNRALAYLYRVYVGCALHGDAKAEDLEKFLELTPMPVTIPESQVFNRLYEIMTQRECKGLPDGKTGSILRRLADRAEDTGGQQGIPFLRYQSAAFFARAGGWKAAEEQGKLAWRPGQPAPYSAPLIQAYLATGRIEMAEKVLLEAKARIDRTYQSEVNYMQQLERQLETAKNALRPH